MVTGIGVAVAAGRRAAGEGAACGAAAAGVGVAVTTFATIVRVVWQVADAKSAKTASDASPMSLLFMPLRGAYRGHCLSEVKERLKEWSKRKRHKRRSFPPSPRPPVPPSIP